MPHAHAKPAVEIDIDLETSSELPAPVDAMSLAHWVGIRHRILWWLVLKRKEMYREIRIKKPHGGVRILHEPAKELKFAQKMILERVLSKFAPQPHIGAYEAERGVKYSTARHAGHAVVLELDIKDFFGSTTRKYVRDFFQEVGWPEESRRLIADLLTYPVRRDLSVVPQGAPSSPKLCNLVADKRFDHQIIDYLARVDSGWLYTRYSDNLIMSHPQQREREEVDAIIHAVKKMVREGGYRVHPEKIRIMRSNNPKRPQRLLGLTINRHPNLSRDMHRKLRAWVHRALTNGFDKVTGLPGNITTPGQATSYLGGLINYYLYISPTDRLRKLKTQFEAAVTAHAHSDVLPKGWELLNGEEVTGEAHPAAEGRQERQSKT